MAAVIYKGRGVFSVGPGDVIAPRPGEVRLDVAYCGVCGTDLHIAHGAMDARIDPPQVIGHEMSGTVAGANSRRYHGLLVAALSPPPITATVLSRKKNP